MLSEKTLQSAYALASAAHAQRRMIAPAAETPLAEAVLSTTREFQILNDNNLDGRCATATGIVDMLRECTSVPDAANRYVHDDVIAALVKMIAPAVQRNFYLAKNAVLPAARKAYEDYKAKASAIDAASLSEYHVDVLALASLWDNASFSQMVSRWDGNAPRPIRLKVLNIPISDEKAFDYIKTGVVAFDEAVQASLTQVEVAEALRSVFGSQPVENLSEAFSLNLMKINRNAIIFLGAKYFQENIPGGLNINLDEYRAYVAEVMAEAGRMTSQAFAKIGAFRRSRQFVLSVEGTSALVESLNWKQFCSDGGDTEVLFGSMLTDKNFQYDALKANADQYRQAYANYVRANTAKFQSLRLEGLRNALVVTAGEQAAALLSGDLSEEVAQAQIKGIDAEARTLQTSAYDAPFQTLCRLIANAVYPGTDVLKILSIYDSCESQVVSKDPREIAALALIHYVTDWLTEQVVVTTFNHSPEL